MEEGASRLEASMLEQVQAVTEMMMHGSVEQGVDAARRLRNLSLPYG
jgi:hypothetical protein